MAASSFLCTGAILAGGQGSRMGQPKEGVLMPDGRRMIEHGIEPLSQICPKIVIVGACRGFSILPESGLLHLPDSEPGRGPLTAIATLLKSGIDKKGYLVAACDQPFLTPDLLRLLVEEPSAIPRIFQLTRLTPFPGYYPVSWLSEIEKGFQTGERSICNLIQKSSVSFVSFPKEWQRFLRNINTPSDLEK